jgi:HAD superfamily hydrolase (TIGR01484 family)
MDFAALACDYDGTLATDGRVADATLIALQRHIASGRRLLLVTGREFDDLASIFPGVDLFDWVVAENGAHLARPDKSEERSLGTRPPEEFLQRLRECGVAPLSVGRVIVATCEPHHTTVSQVIRELGLELQVILNRGAVMVLPSGIDKATGLVAALEAMALSPRSVVGIGDAENDLPLLAVCGLGVAVANALPMLKASADLVTHGANGAGVIELINRLLADDVGQSGPPRQP